MAVQKSALDKRSQVSLTFGTYIKPFFFYYDLISALTVIEKRTFQDYSHINALGIKFDLAIK